MNSDRELLELAAKAYWGDEIDDVCSIRWLDEDQAIGYMHGDNQDHNGRDIELCWNPLEDDGAALRLVVKLGLMVDTSCQPALILCAGPCGIGLKESARSDPYVATRRSIVRAAADIGKAMR